MQTNSTVRKPLLLVRMLHFLHGELDLFSCILIQVWPALYTFRVRQVTSERQRAQMGHECDSTGYRSNLFR